MAVIFVRHAESLSNAGANNDFVAENGCRVVSNQRGYASEFAAGGMGFRPDLVLEV